MTSFALSSNDQEQVIPSEWRRWLHTAQSRFGAKEFELTDLAQELSKVGSGGVFGVFFFFNKWFVCLFQRLFFCCI